VAVSARKKGVAQQLLAALVAEADRREWSRIELDVWSFNQAAQTAFRRLGFATFNERMVLNREHLGSNG
jgi:ribosomal protein S18 acetylase RimI-like enzyme